MKDRLDGVRVLFLCTGNSSRSQMAEAFGKARAEAPTEIFSAGIELAPVHPFAIKVMSEVDVDISSYRSKSVHSLGLKDFDVVITLCDRAAEICPVLPGIPSRVDWNLEDPTKATGTHEEKLDVFRRVRDKIRNLVNDLFERGYIRAFVSGKRQANMILNNLSDAIVAHDMARKIFYFNKAAEKMTEFARDEVIGRDCHDVFPGGLCGGKCDFCDSSIPLLHTEVVKRNLRIMTKSGGERDVEMRIKPMYDVGNRPIGIVASISDQTREMELERRLGEVEQFSGIIGRDGRMQEVFELIRDVADSTVSVLVQGESGTGKELVAAAIHHESHRANKLFVPINCGALPENLLESELFGHVRGAFTGAIRDKKGRFELAHEGTIFLDEIGDISQAMQVKLLRVLQDGAFERVGSEKTIRVNVRVISATNKDLLKEIREGRFREDLYYRLSVVPVQLPALRERGADIPLLAEHILKRSSLENKRGEVHFSSDALDLMLSYSWPGNVRELQNWIQFALVKCKQGLILPEHLPPNRPGLIAGSGTITLSSQQQFGRRRRRRKLTMEAVREALDATQGNKLAAAKQLGVSRATLYRFFDEQDMG